MYLYNSATHKKEEFKTHTPGHVEMYTCGPTVYHFAHIGNLRSYIAEGEVLDVPTRSFGGIGIFAINEMGRFYRHVLVEKRYPHHGAVAFNHCGKALFDVFRYLGIADIAYNQPASLPYPTENPFA